MGSVNCSSSQTSGRVCVCVCVRGCLVMHHCSAHCFAHDMAQSVVNKALQDNLVMIFSKTHCPHCLRAKRILDVELGQSKYAVMELENRPDCAAIQDHLRQLTGARTVPRVFLQGQHKPVRTLSFWPQWTGADNSLSFSGKCIGGGAETAQLQKNGKLKQLLKEIGAL